LNHPADVSAALRSVDGVRTLEAWGYSRTAVYRAGKVDVVRTYPDGGHGSLAILAPPASTELVRFPLLAGRWLRSDDTDAVVLNHMALGQFPGIALGHRVTLSLDGRPTEWRVVGIVEEVGSAGVAYVTDRAFARVAGSDGRTRMLRVATTATTSSARENVIRAFERRLEAEQVSVEALVPLAVLRTAMGDHVVILIRMLLAMAAIMITVAMLGLASAIGSNVVERAREIGVMKTLGATPARIGRLVVAEALILALLSWVFAILLAVPLTLLVGKTVGTLAFRVRLPFVLDPHAVGLWLVLLVVIGTISALVPAFRASRLTVRETLARP
jgi:putative ABC transport system permease protein